MAAADTIMTSRLPCPASSGGSSGHAKMPATLKFLVSNESGEEEGGLKDTANFIRVQELFSVIMSVCSDGEGYDVVSLTGTDADRIEKTRVSKPLTLKAFIVYHFLQLAASPPSFLYFVQEREEYFLTNKAY